ncbi:CLIP domain-containing serine protease C9-like [Ochlerotatus camptorhynchus]|uniref:CLIP domain-containing serine protease C9-like n=1 Tax=Ochlerotatus camptorhynchus TaxID=644619 RepID=UPI0031D50F76
MVPLVLILLLVHSITCQIVYQDQNSDLHEGDPCYLNNDNTTIGQCRKLKECGRKHASLASRCGFVGKEPIICCDVLQRQCEKNAPSKQRITDHIVGNTLVVDVGEFPFMALVTFENPMLRCGASLVSNRFLLTAAHCIRTGDSKPIAVKLGTNEVDDPGAELYKIKKTFVHGSYQRLLKQNDIGIIELEKNVKLNSIVKPICLYTKHDELPESTDLTTMGWGVGDDGNLSNALLKGTIRPIRRADCQRRFDVLVKKGLKLSENQLCALGDKDDTGIFTDSCGGDSGGPLVLQRGDKCYLVGITSTGSGCGSNYFSGIYTKVNKHLSWIIKTVEWDATP